MSTPSDSNKEELSLEDFTGQVSFIRQLIRATLGGTFAIIKRNLVLILVLMAVLGGAAYMLKSNTPTTYTANMTLSFNWLTKKMYADMVSKLDALASKKAHEALAAHLDLTTEEAEQVISVQAFNARGDALALDLDFERVPITIVVETKSSELLPKLQEGIVHYFDQSPFVKREIFHSKRNLEAQLEHFGKQADWIDSVKVAYTASLSSPEKRTGLSLSEIMDQGNGLFAKIEEIKRAQGYTENISVMDPFVGMAVNNRNAGVRWGFLGAVMGFLIGFVIGFLRVR